jgi:GNAT superfamily N-acetyltransferase
LRAPSTDPGPVRIVPAAAVPPETLWRAFVEGFKGYVRPFEIGFEPFMGMIRAEDVDFDGSVVALDPAGEPVGVALLAIRGRTCWCSGLGVAPPRRRHGLGRTLMEAIIAAARERGLPRMRLECIDGNDAARALYDRLGYRPLRRLDVFEGFPATPRRPRPLAEQVVEVEDPERVWAAFDDYHPIPPPWQGALPGRRAEAAAGPLTGLALAGAGRPAAYVLARVREPEDAPVYLLDAGILPDLADPAAVLTELIARLLAEHPERAVVAFNIPAEAPLGAALRAHGVPVTLTQTEMVLDL